MTLYVGSATPAECGFVVEWLSLDATGGMLLNVLSVAGWLKPRRTLMRLSVSFCCVVILSGKAVEAESAFCDESIESVPPAGPARP